MIFYKSGGIWYLLKVCQMRGSVFPASSATALPCGLVAAGVCLLINEGYLPFEGDSSILNQTQAWAGFSFLCGFLIVFRTSQAYSRFWEGCSSTHTMRAEWFDACSAIISFCDHSAADQASVMGFKHTIVRLFSMLHASALADLEDLNNSGHEDGITAFRYELIDPQGIDAASLETLRTSATRVELLFEWIQMLIVRNIQSGVLSIPPPILSRAFQEIANGMVAFHDCVKIAYVPFPFPYAQNCDFLLLLHWCLAPFVFSQWVSHPLWAFLFVFIQVFVLWSLNFIAVEIENPFGTDKNDLDGHHMQTEMNRHLLMMLKPSTRKLPTLSDEACWSADPMSEINNSLSNRCSSFLDVWRAGSRNKVMGIARKDTNFRWGCLDESRRETELPVQSDEDERQEWRMSKLSGGQSQSVTLDSSQRRAPVGGCHEQPVQQGGPVSSQWQVTTGSWEILPRAPWGSEPKTLTDRAPEDVALVAAEGDRVYGISRMTPKKRALLHTGRADSDADKIEPAAGRPPTSALGHSLEDIIAACPDDSGGEHFEI